jgi:hypothetical protein
MEVKVRVTRKRVGAVVAALALVLTGVALGVTSNAYADANGVYHGCVGTESGILRMLAAGESCRQKEAPIDWNQVGPQGPQGEKGETGDTGPQAPQGIQGPQGLQGPKGTRATPARRARRGRRAKPGRRVRRGSRARRGRRAPPGRPGSRGGGRRRVTSSWTRSRGST